MCELWIGPALLDYNIIFSVCLPIYKLTKDNIIIFSKKKMLNNYLTKIINQAYEFEKSAKHPLTESSFKHVKTENKKLMKRRSFVSTLVIFGVKCIIDSLWMTFLGKENNLSC